MDAVMSINDKDTEELQNQISELEAQMRELQLKSAQYEGKVDSIEKSQLLVSQSYTSTYDSSLFWYSIIISIVGLLVAVSGVIGFVLIKNYKKREVAQVVDEAEANLEKKLSNNEQMAAYLSAGLKSDDFNKKLDALKKDLFNELNRDLVTYLEDKMNKQDSDESAQASNDTSDILEDDDGRKE
ncbi:hypothetical protein AFK76_11330 [Idiomarina zobellii]|uniref:Uncharacterized protein n=2 Tax=Idiomarina zobellii TaxID=86103 RepID=A0A837NEJ3_9GAMM|nr:hypothetical protein AFK76_11330 [Idiomarina zobellii]|tara:strand:+ start:2724 stop:3275 length:552 start_codon:yes stop_codon:yes gene_type:complete